MLGTLLVEDASKKKRLNVLILSSGCRGRGIVGAGSRVPLWLVCVRFQAHQNLAHEPASEPRSIGQL